MTLDPYADLRAKLERATPGPWRDEHFRSQMAGDDYWRVVNGAFVVAMPQHNDEANAAYIAACAPDTIRALLDERDALTREFVAYQSITASLQSEHAALRAARDEALTIIEKGHERQQRLMDTIDVLRAERDEGAQTEDGE